MQSERSEQGLSWNVEVWSHISSTKKRPTLLSSVPLCRVATCFSQLKCQLEECKPDDLIWHNQTFKCKLMALMIWQTVVTKDERHFYAELLVSDLGESFEILSSADITSSGCSRRVRFCGSCTWCGYSGFRTIISTVHLYTSCNKPSVCLCVCESVSQRLCTRTHFRIKTR